MAVVQYSNVYRQGAASGSPVTSVYVCDSYTEIPTGIYGDMAFAKDIGIVYVNRGAWTPIVLQTAGDFPLTGDILIEKIDPQIKLKNIRHVNHLDTFGRLMGGYQNRPELSYNLYSDNNGWHKDRTDLDGYLFIVGPGNRSFDFYTWLVGENLVRKASILATGEILEKGRNIVLGEVYDQSIDSSILTCTNGAVITNIVNWVYKFSLVGNILTIWFNISFTTNILGDQLFIKFPVIGGVRALGKFDGIVGTCIIEDNIWRPAKTYTNYYWDSFVVAQIDNSGFNYLTPTVQGTIQIPIFGV